MGVLDGKVAMITGAGRGLGRAFAVGFAQAGAKVVIVGRRLGPADHPETLLHTVGLVKNAGGTALAVQGSVTDMAAMQQAVTQAVAKFGQIDILVNNAGMWYGEGFLDISLAQWQEMMDGYLTGTFICCKVCVPIMLQHGGGHIINVGSSAATSDAPDAIAYGTVRGGLVRYTIKLANELKPHNIAVNSVAPGFVMTERVQEFLGSQDLNAARTTARDPARARKPEDTVPAMVWVAQQPPASFTGQIVSGTEFGKTWGPVATAR